MFGVLLNIKKFMAQSDTELELKIEDGPTIKKKAKEIYDLVFNDNSNLSMSAFRNNIQEQIKKGLFKIKSLQNGNSERKAF